MLEMVIVGRSWVKRKYTTYSSLSIGKRTRSEYKADRFSNKSAMACAEFKMIVVRPNSLIEIISLPAQRRTLL